jgi:hypothetical protein
VETADISKRRRILLSSALTVGSDPAGHKKELKGFRRGGNAGDEIIYKANWLNETTREMPAGAGYLVGVKPTRWLSHEAEVEWDVALFVAVPAFSDRIVGAWFSLLS